MKRFLTAVFAVALASVGFSQTVDDNPVVKQQILDQVSDVLSKNAFVPGLDFGKWAEFLKQEQPQIDAAKNDDEFQKAVNTALRKFGATHMVLSSPRVAEMRRDGSSVGIGIGSQITPEGLLVTRTVTDAPAERAGIVAGDLIVAVDGQPVHGAAGISGKEGFDVTVTVRHADKKTEDYILTRRRFSILRPEELTWVDKETAKLTIYSFDMQYDHAHVEAMMKDAENARNLILDLRDNGGGSIANFRKLLGLFVSPSKPVGTFIDRRMVDDYAAAMHGNPTDLAAIAKWSPRKLRALPSETLPVYKGHVIVLVNKLSGSASEIIAAGLRDTIGATVVGTKSAGAVLVSMYVTATNGFMLQYPLSDYVTIQGLRLEGNGVTPDVEVTAPILTSTGSVDNAVKKAIELFGAARLGATTEIG